MKIRIGFSPCPNDTFIFDALVNRKIDSGELEFEPVLDDVQTLNEWSNRAMLDVTKLSFPAFFQNLETYEMLNAGAALGKGVGPLLIAKKAIDQADVDDKRIAIPGEQTTANFLLSFAFPGAKNKVAMNFSKIEDAVLNGQVDLGVIIHENRFTYREKGLVKICDLGEIWEEREKVPIPLGGIVVKRSLDPSVKRKIDALIKESVEHSFAAGSLLSPYIKEHAQAMDENVMRQHIELYVNEHSINLGKQGRAAIEKLYRVYCQITGKKAKDLSLFVD
ncbi:MAG: 1,4-dihydroxy-6-naphthoate synthase [Flavisolibacter sp.]